MDCLDRTNVVQSVFARNLAHKALFKLNFGHQPKGETFERFPDKLEEIFRESWTNNANVCSILYTGTPALKTDFTRTGKRTPKGAMDDGYHSCLRYYINNFTDGYNQDCLDYATSKLSGLEVAQSRKGVGALLNSFLVLLILFSGFMYLANWGIKAKLGGEGWSGCLVHWLVFGVSVFVFQKVIMVVGSKFVDLPTKK